MYGEDAPVVFRRFRKSAHEEALADASVPNELRGNLGRALVGLKCRQP